LQQVVTLENYEKFARILLSEDVSFEMMGEILTGIGITDPVKAEKNIQLLGGRGEGFEAFRKVFPHALRSLAGAADPDAALNNWERLVGARRDRKSHFSLLTESPRTLDVLLKIVGASHYLSNILISRPDLLRAEIESGEWEKPLDIESLDAELSALLDVASDYDSSLNVLREFKWRHMLGIGARDICATADVWQTTLETSRLAEACVQAALGIAEKEVAGRFGSPAKDSSGDAASMVVLAFGKLGGEELNYSSDIDLTFMYSHDCETEGSDSISNHQYFSKVAEKCIDALARHTDMGHLFRVDMRLRPMGSKGPLVNSLEAHLFYYESYGEWWERQALLKARPVAGDMELAHRFLEEMRPFIYPKYIDHRGIRELQALKLRTERLVDIEGLTKVEVKLGRGGIRDIEFTIQFQQLLNGGRHPELRGTNTLAAIGTLEEIGTISQAEKKSLADAYQFLRRLENRLQILQNRQLHVLPSDPHEIETLARGLGYQASGGKTGGEIFRDEYSGHTDRVRELFDKFFGKMFKGTDRAAPIIDLIMNPDPSEAEIDAALGHYGFEDRPAALKNLRLLAEGSASSPYPSRTRDLFAGIVGILLQHLEQSPDSDMALNNMQRCVAALGAPSTFYEILASNPKAFKPLIALSSYSDHLIRVLVNDPGVIDFLLGTRILEKESSRAIIQKALGEFISVNPDFFEAVQRFKNGELLRIGLRDTLGLADIAEVTRELSYVAGAVLEQVYGRCLEEHVSRYGEPLASDDSPATMSILGVGKLGGREINYASDLDVIFVYSAGGQTTGGRSEAISCQQFFASLAAKVMKKMAELNPYGYLYKMDARLRPDGAQGLLAVSSDSFIEYYGKKSAIWEKRAMTKLRLIAGDEALGKQIERFVRQTIYASGFFGPDVVEDAMTMLGKIIGNVESEAGEGVQIKGAEGGIVEIEFLVQLLQLKHGPDSEKLRAPNTLKAFAALVDGGFISRKEHDDLTATLVFLRRIEDRLRLMHDRSLNELPSDAEELDKLALRLDMAGVPDQRPGEVLVGTIESHINRSHRVFEERIGELLKG
jgi:glutamate-ammonia-ligase adenylyltransferase